MEGKIKYNSSNNFKKKNKMGWITIIDIKAYYIATIIKKVWYCKGGRHIEH